MNTIKQIQRLPETLTNAGNQYHIFKRGKQTLVYGEVNSAGKKLAYEVFQIRIQKAGETFGTWYPAREKFPTSEDFGKWVWWCHNLEKALGYFVKLERGEKCGHRSSKEVIHSEDRSSQVVDPIQNPKMMTVT